jgi:hypothetical protein
LDPEAGVTRFAGQRVILLDTVATGMLRHYLVDNFGFTAARTIRTQFGFAHGWRIKKSSPPRYCKIIYIQSVFSHAVSYRDPTNA